MVLTFALCATFAFAQTNKSVTKAKVADRASVAVSEEVVAKQAGYTGSIFTKDDEIFVCGFTAADENNYSTAAVGAGEQVNGTAIPQNQQNAFHATWRRLPGNVDWITLSPKDLYLGEAARPVLQSADELKVVFDGRNLPPDYSHIAIRHDRFLQPCDTGDAARNAAVTAATVEYIKAHPQWRLSLQIHKILNIR